jgi:hypothetical protein
VQNAVSFACVNLSTGSQQRCPRLLNSNTAGALLVLPTPALYKINSRLGREPLRPGFNLQNVAPGEVLSKSTKNARKDVKFSQLARAETQGSVKVSSRYKPCENQC